MSTAGALAAAGVFLFAQWGLVVAARNSWHERLDRFDTFVLGAIVALAVAAGVVAWVHGG